MRGSTTAMEHETDSGRPPRFGRSSPPRITNLRSPGDRENLLSPPRAGLRVSRNASVLGGNHRGEQRERRGMPACRSSPRDAGRAGRPWHVMDSMPMPRHATTGPFRSFSPRLCAFALSSLPLFPCRNFVCPRSVRHYMESDSLLLHQDVPDVPFFLRGEFFECSPENQLRFDCNGLRSLRGEEFVVRHVRR